MVMLRFDIKAILQTSGSSDDGGGGGGGDFDGDGVCGLGTSDVRTVEQCRRFLPAV